MINQQPEELINIIADVIKNNTKHKWYKRVTELADQYKKIITNEDTDSFFKQVAKREEQEWFEQRKRLTNLILMPMANHVKQPLNKVKRSNDLKQHIGYDKDANGERATEIQKLLHGFCGEQSLDEYCRNRIIDLSYIDPNSWVVVEWPTVDKPSEKRVQPYPFEVTAHQAVMFEYTQYVLQYLITDVVTDKMHRLTIYGQNQTVIFQQFDNRKKQLPVRQAAGLQDIDGELYYYINRQFYHVTVSIPHNLGYVPAVRIGYINDEYTDGTTFVNLFHNALPYFMDSVKSKSEHDLTFALHAFPIRIQYEQMCPVCHGTKVNANGDKCGTCNGTGTLLTTSTQDTITFPMPREKDEFIPLDSILTFVRPPSDIISLMVDNIDSIKTSVFEAVWGKNTYLESAGNVTAEQIISEENSKYDNLYSCAENICKFWTFAARTIARVTNLSEGSTIWMSVGKEFSVKSRAELIAELKVQKEVGMSAEVTQKTERDIVKIDYSNEPAAIRKYDVKQYFKPFSDKSPEQISVILQAKAETTLEDRVLWQNYEAIWNGLELQFDVVYEKNYKELRALVDSAVADMIVKIKGQQTTTEQLTFE